jgi:chemotaxis protein histidine kinase CheA
MGQSMSTLDFFLIEGNDLLEQLDALAQTPPGTFLKGDDLLRLARAYRGSAVMGGQMAPARSAQGLEACARAIREGRVAWTEGTRAEVIRAVDDCKVLMKRLRSPEAGDAAKADAIGTQLERLSGRPSATLRAAGGPVLDSGARAFVAREAAAIASVLQQAARTLRGEPGNPQALTGLAPSMSALRGVAILNDLPPLGDILAAIDNAARDAAAGGPSRGAEADILEAAAKALARAAREVVDKGHPDADSEDARAFASRLLATLSLGGPIVDIATLFVADQGPHIVKQGAKPPAPATSEMVSHGEYLNAASAELSRAETSVQRDLRLFGLAVQLRPLAPADGSPLASGLGRLAEAAREAIGRGAASQASDAFISQIRVAAAALTAAERESETQLASRLGQAADALAALGEKPAPAAPAIAAAPVPSVGVLGEADLATSYLTLEQLIAERGIPMGTLDELVDGGTVGARAATAPPAPGRRTTGARAADAMAARPSGARAAEAPIVPIESLAPDEASVVPIESLLYSGDAAVRRLRELKAEIDAATRNKDARLPELIREVFDLVELGLGAGR